MVVIVCAVPPKWVVEPEDQSVILGNSVVIPCQADGSPTPTILWKQAIGEYLKLHYRLHNAHNLHGHNIFVPVVR